MTFSKESLYDWSGNNVWLFKQVNAISGPTYDKVMLLITELGTPAIVPAVMFALSLYILYTYVGRRIKDKGANKHFLGMWIGVFLVMIIAVGVNYKTIHYLKEHFAYPRPYVALAEEGVRHLEADRGEIYGSRSFPSGHTALITIVVMSLWPALGGKMRILGLVTIAAVAWSRMALGVHFPADLAGGFLLAILQVVIIRFIVYKLLRSLFGIHASAS